MRNSRATSNLALLTQICSKLDRPVEPSLDAGLLEQSIEFLSSSAALESVKADPYWPKWTGPWWHMLLLFEMRLTSSIPEKMVEEMVAAMDNHYLRTFPFTEAEIPDGLDAMRHIACHCALGTMHQLLTAYGIDVETRLPWIRNWYLQYQIAEDGGLNCDESAYTKSPPRSSIVSTVPPMEAMLTCTSRPFTDHEINFLDRSADYLVRRQLFRSSRSHDVIDESWLELCFPRFYMYDVLRGLTVVLRWAHSLKRSLPIHAVDEAFIHIDRQFPDGRLSPQRQSWRGAGTRWLEEDSGRWIRKETAPTYPLLVAVSELAPSPYLTSIWSETKELMAALIAEQLIVES